MKHCQAWCLRRLKEVLVWLRCHWERTCGRAVRGWFFFRNKSMNNLFEFVCLRWCDVLKNRQILIAGCIWVRLWTWHINNYIKHFKCEQSELNVENKLPLVLPCCDVAHVRHEDASQRTEDCGAVCWPRPQIKVSAPTWKSILMWNEQNLCDTRLDFAFVTQFLAIFPPKSKVSNVKPRMIEGNESLSLISLVRKQILIFMFSLFPFKSNLKSGPNSKCWKCGTDDLLRFIESSFKQTQCMSTCLLPFYDRRNSHH